MIHRFHRERAGRAAFDEFGNAETCRSFNRRRRVRRLHGPDTLSQPIDECEIVGCAPKNRLAEVNVCLDETGNDRATICVDHCIGYLSSFADARDAPIVDEKIATRDGIRRIHRYERAVLNEDH
jgi:hypothetical protein